MKHLLFITILLAAPARAGQNLPVLDELFASLNDSLETTTAAVTGKDFGGRFGRHQLPYQTRLPSLSATRPTFHCLSA